MDATHPIWRTPVVHDAAAARRFGVLIRMARTAQGLSLIRAGELIGYSASTLSRIETGQRKLTDVTALRRFAEQLGIPPALFGLTSSPPAPPTGSPTGAAPLYGQRIPTTVNPNPIKGGGDAVHRRQLLTALLGVTGSALLGAPVIETATESHHLEPRSRTVPQLRRDLAAARASFDACRYQDLSATLPRLVATVQHNVTAATGQHKEQLYALLAGTYSLTSHVCTKLPDNTLAWITAERARTAAHHSGDPTAIAEAARVASIAMRRNGHYTHAVDLLTDTATSLGAEATKPGADLLAAYSALLLTASYTAAHTNDRHRALDLLAEASTAAHRANTHPRTHASTRPRTPTLAPDTAAAIYQVSVHNALGDAGTALHHLVLSGRRARRVLELSGLLELFTVATSTQEALSEHP